MTDLLPRVSRCTLPGSCIFSKRLTLQAKNLHISKCKACCKHQSGNAKRVSSTRSAWKLLVSISCTYGTKLEHLVWRCSNGISVSLSLSLSLPPYIYLSIYKYTYIYIHIVYIYISWLYSKHICEWSRIPLPQKQGLHQMCGSRHPRTLHLYGFLGFGFLHLKLYVWCE